MALGYDGSIRIDTKINSREFKTGVDGMTAHFNSGIGKMMASLGKLAAAIGIAFGVSAIINFGKEAVNAASNLSSALTGLKSIMDGQGRSFQQAQGFIQDYIKDGLIPMENAVTAYKNLAMRGYSTEQIEKTLIALKDASAFGRQASLSMGDAVSTATEGLRNENSILVDNAGVTKNVSQMWADYAKQIGVGVNSLTKAQKIQAEVNGIMEESKYQVGDASKVSETYAGQMAMLSFQFQQFKVALGEAIIPVAKAVIPGIQSIILTLTQLANVFAQVTTLMFGGEMKNPAKDEMEDQKELEDGLTESGKDAAGATDGLTDATEGMGDASKEAAKEIKGVVAGFDDINKLAGDTSKNVEGATEGLGGLDIGDFATGGELFGNVTISPEVVKFVEELKKQLQELADILGRIWNVFKDSWDKYGASVIEAAKAALSSIWELLKEIASTFADVFESGAGERFLSNIMAIVSGILSFISTLSDQLKDVWDRMGEDLLEAFFYAVNSILELVRSIGSAFSEAWNSGVGVEILETIMSILTGIFELVGNLATRMREAWESNNNGIAIWTSILNIISEVIQFVDQLVWSTANWASGLNLEPIVQSFNNLLYALEPLVTTILSGLGEAYKNVLLPFAEWTIEEAIPKVIQMVAAAFKALNSAIDAIKPLAEWIWNNWLLPLSEWTGEIFISAIEEITRVLTEFSMWAEENPEKIQTIAMVIMGFLASFAATTAITAVPKVIGVLQGLITSFMHMDFAAIGANASIGLLVGAFLLVLSAWKDMSGLQKVVAVLGLLTAGALAAAIAVGALQSAWSLGVAAAAIAAGIVAITASVNAAANSAKSSASQYSGSGRKPYSMQESAFNSYNLPSIPQANTYKIPKLASGAVIPPNRKFIAELGDQKSGTNVESPLSTIEEAVMNAMARSGGTGTQEIVIQNHINLDGREIYQNQKQISRLMGGSLVNAGG